jgi:Large polyvalent protein-associated domain 7
MAETRHSPGRVRFGGRSGMRVSDRGSVHESPVRREPDAPKPILESNTVKCRSFPRLARAFLHDSVRRVQNDSAHYQGRNTVQDLIPWQGVIRWSQRLQDWVEQLLERRFGAEQRLDLPSPPDRTSSVVPKSELAQFPRLVFHGNGADLDHRAEVNDDAIRAGLVWFKHRWPGELAEIDGSDEFRRRAWGIADEVGVPLKGPRPGSRHISVR